jgi:hypothetical protein
MPARSEDIEIIRALADKHCRGLGPDTWKNWIGEDARSRLTHYTFDAKSVTRGFTAYVSDALVPGRMLLFVAYDDDGKPQGDVLVHIESHGEMTRDGIGFEGSIIACSDKHYDGWRKDVAKTKTTLKFHLCRHQATECTLPAAVKKKGPMTLHIDQWKVSRPSGALRLGSARKGVINFVTQVLRERGQVELALLDSDLEGDARVGASGTVTPPEAGRGARSSRGAAPPPPAVDPEEAVEASVSRAPDVAAEAKKSSLAHAIDLEPEPDDEDFEARIRAKAKEFRTEDSYRRASLASPTPRRKEPATGSSSRARGGVDSWLRGRAIETLPPQARARPIAPIARDRGSAVASSGAQGSGGHHRRARDRPGSSDETREGGGRGRRRQRESESKRKRRRTTSSSMGESSHSGDDASSQDFRKATGSRKEVSMTALSRRRPGLFLQKGLKETARL